MSKPVLKQLAHDYVRNNSRTLPNVVGETDVSRFLRDIENPAMNITSYVGEPTPNDVVRDDESTEVSDEIELFSSIEPVSPEQQKKYFYQQLVVAKFDKDLEGQKGVELFGKIVSNVNAFDEGDYLDDGEGITPATIFLRVKFQDLKDHDRRIPKSLTYNQFKESVQGAYNANTLDDASTASNDEEKTSSIIVSILTGRGQQYLEPVVGALGDQQGLNQGQREAVDRTVESLLRARGSDSSAHPRVLTHEQKVPGARAAPTLTSEALRSHSSQHRMSMRSGASVASGDGEDDLRSEASDEDDRRSEGEYQEPDSDLNSVNSEDVLLRRSSAAPDRGANLPRPPTRGGANNRSTNADAANQFNPSSNRASAQGGEDIEGILSSIQLGFAAILEEISKGVAPDVIRQQLEKMRAHLQTIAEGAPAQGRLEALIVSVAKIGESVGKIKPGAPGAPGLPGKAGASPDMRGIEGEIRNLAINSAEQSEEMRQEFALMRRNAANVNRYLDGLGAGLEDVRSRFDTFDEGQSDVLSRQAALSASQSSLAASMEALRLSQEEMSKTVDHVRDHIAGGVVKTGALKQIDHAHLRAHGYDQDSEFLIPEIKGRRTATHTGIEQHESCGIPVFVYEDMNEFSIDVESAALKKWPDNDNEKVVSSIARIEGKGYCAVTASSRGVTKTFLDEGQFEEMEKQAQTRYENVIKAQAKEADLKELVKNLEAERDLQVKEGGGFSELAENTTAIIEYLNQDVLGSLAKALDPKSKMSAKDRDRALKDFNGWDYQNDLGFDEDLDFDESRSDIKLQARKKVKAFERGIGELSDEVIVSRDEGDDVRADYLEVISNHLKNNASTFDPNEDYLEGVVSDPIVQGQIKAQAIERCKDRFAANIVADPRWEDGVQYLQDTILQPFYDALNPNVEMDQSDRDAAITAFHDWTPEEDQWLNDNEFNDALPEVVQCSEDIAAVRTFANHDVEKRALEKAAAIERARDIFELENATGEHDEAIEYLNNVLDFVYPALDYDPASPMSRSDRDAKIKIFNDWDPSQDENKVAGHEDVVAVVSQEIDNAAAARVDSGSELSYLYKLLSRHIENSCKQGISNSVIVENRETMESSVSRFDHELSEDDRMEKLERVNKKATPSQKDSARKFASNQTSRDLADDVKQSVKTSEINDLDSSEVDHMIDHMTNKMHGAAASVTGHNKNRRNESAEKAREILTAPMPHTAKNGISFFRPRDSNTVTIAFNYNNVKDNKLDGDSLAYFHIPGTNEMYGRAQICKDPTKPMAVRKNGKEVLEYHKFGDVVIDPDTIFHRNAAGGYDHFGTTGALWNDMESTFGEKGKNAITLYKALGVKAISQINRAGKGEEPDVERKAAILCEGQAFAYNGERQEAKLTHVKGVQIAQGREEKALGKKKNAVDAEGNDVEFELGKVEAKFAKVGKCAVGNGKETEELPLFVRISTDASGTITHEAVPYVSKAQATLGEDVIQDLLCKQFCERNGMDIKAIARANKDKTLEGLISIDAMVAAYPDIEGSDLDDLRGESLRIKDEFKNRKDDQKNSIVIAGTKYPVYGTKVGERSINIDCEPRKFDDARDDVIEAAKAEAKNTKLVITVVDPKTGEKKPVVSAHDEFEGLGHRKQGKSEKVKATVQDAVDLGAVPESENFSHVNRARSPKTRGGGRM